MSQVKTANKPKSGGGQKLIYKRVGDEALWDALARYARDADTSAGGVIAEALAAYGPLKAFMAAEARKNPSG